MEEKNKKILIDKIIKEQDLVSLYAYNNFNKSLDIMQEYSNGILYSDLSRFILKFIWIGLTYKNLLSEFFFITW